MKFSYRQILASAGGAVLSAVIASVFGVKGTIVGVAIGSIAATMGTALVFQSIERTNQAVKQGAVRVPESTKLLRRLGGTDAAGVATRSEPAAESAVAEETATSAATEPADTSQSSEPTEVAPVVAPRPKLPWPVVVGTIVGVFVFALVFVTVVELIAGRPLADIFGHAGGGTTVEKIFESPSTTLPPPPTTTTTSTSSTTTTSSSTSTTVPGSSTTSTDLGSSSTTSTTGVSPTTTTSGVATSP